MRTAVISRPLGLDKHAADYARLLADPCNGPLVSGPFGDGGGGIISRFEIDTIVNNSATDVASELMFLPANNQGYIGSTAITSDSLAVTPAPTSQVTPGQIFLIANASQYRCLSACIQIYWPGTELNRSGIVSLGQYSANIITQVSSVGSLRSSAQYVERMPEQMAEIIWRPNSYDLEWSYPNAPTVSALQQKASALCVTASGFPVSTGIRYRVVAVYEWFPLSGGGLVQTDNRGTTSANTFADVIRKLDTFGDWMYHGALNTGKAMSSIAAGVRAVGQVAYGAKKLAPLLMG